MAFNYGPYTFDAQADGDAAEFLWTDQTGTTNALQGSNTSGRWCWDSDSTTSSNVGPDGGQEGNPDGYAYTEMSSQAVGDIWYVEFDTDLDASANDIVFSFYWCARGDGSAPEIQVQTNENGAGWVNRGTETGATDTTIPGTSGATEWNLKSVDLTGLVSGTATRVRVMMTMNGATSWHHDVGFDTVSIVGTTISTGPSITTISDTKPTNYQTGIVIDGTNFGADKKGGALVLTPTSTYVNGVDQTTTAWNDTQITFNLDRGSVPIGTAYLWVREDLGTVSAVGYSIDIGALASSVTSVSDGDIQPDETGVVVGGSNFFSTQGVGKVELCPGISYGSPVEQTVTSWADGSITTTVVQGALSVGTVYAFVTNSDGGRNGTGYAVTLSVPLDPIITNIEDETLIVGESGVFIDGSNFGAVKGTGKLEMCASSTYGSPAEQFTSSWNDSIIEFEVSLGALSIGSNYMFVTNDAGLRNATGYFVNIQAGASSDGLYQTTNLQLTVTSSGLTATAFLIGDE